MSIFDRLFKKNTAASSTDPSSDQTKPMSDLQPEMEMVLGHKGYIDKSVLSRAFDKITDQKNLEKIAAESTIDQARMWAAGMLENKALANSVYNHLRKYSTDQLIRIAAQQEYREPSPDDVEASDWTNPDMDIARLAVGKISDQDLLIRIVREKHYEIEIEAQKRLMDIIDPDTDQEVLFEITDTFGYIPLRVKAAGMLKDKELLKQIANKRYFLGDDINAAAKKRLSELT